MKAMFCLPQTCSAVQPIGYEIILGSSIDPQLGPVLLFGMGGCLVEVFKDSAVGLPPLNANLARKMLEETKLYKALLGVRGMKSVNIDALIQIMVRFSVLIVDLPEILECDINPLIASEDSILSLDARVVLHDPKIEPEDWPQPAIRPYPHQYVKTVDLTDKMPAACLQLTFAINSPIKHVTSPICLPEAGQDSTYPARGLEHETFPRA